MVRSTCSTVDQDGRQQTGGHGDDGAHADGEPVALGQSGARSGVGAAPGGGHGEQRGHSDGCSNLPGSIDERTGEALFGIGDAGRSRDGRRRKWCS